MSHTRPVLLVALSALGLAVLVASAGSAADPASGDRWPAWRGADGQGIADGAWIPLEWSATKNVRWKTALPGRGLSSPVVWGDSIFLTTALEGEVVPGAKAIPHVLEGEPFVHPDAMGADRRHTFKVLSLDARDGSLLWERTAWEGIPVDSRHKKGSFASPTTVTDGEREPAGRARRGLAGGGRRADLHPWPQALVLDRRHSRVLIDRPGDNETT